MTEHKNSIEKVYWQDVRKQVMAVNPGFAEVIDAVSPGKDLPLYKAAYAYGQLILKDGVFQVPTPDGGLAPYNDPSLSKEIQDSFQYALSAPIGIVLNHALEIFAEHNDMFLTGDCPKPGTIFALWSLLRPAKNISHSGGKMWNISSGARSLIMLPKLSFSRSFKRLKKAFNLSLRDMPEKMTEQATLFTELANSDNFEESWATEILLFTEPWFKLINDNQWKDLRLFLFEKAWSSTSFLRDQMVFDFTFSKALDVRNMRPNPYLVDVVKHLYHMAGSGNYPGYIFSTNDQVAPISSLQKIFADIYDLNTAPTFLNLEHVSHLQNDRAIYYSLNLPTQLFFSPRSNQVHNNLDDLREVKHIQQVTQDYFRYDDLELKGLPLYNALTKTKFEYFHTTEDLKEGIVSSKKLPEFDRQLQEILNLYPDKSFCHSSAFLRGCIRVTGNE